MITIDQSNVIIDAQEANIDYRVHIGKVIARIDADHGDLPSKWTNAEEMSAADYVKKAAETHVSIHITLKGLTIFK